METFIPCKMPHLRISIRINVDDHNYGDIPDFLDFLQLDTLGDRVSLVYVNPTQPVGHSVMGWNAHVWEPQTKAARLTWLWQEMDRRGMPVEVFPEYMPCGALYLPSSVVSSDGELFPCIGFIGNSSLAKGNLAGRPPSDDYVSFMSLDAWERCKGCTFLPVCGGGCRWLASVLQGNHKAPMCELPFFTTAYPQFLRLKFSQERLASERSGANDAPAHII